MDKFSGGLVQENVFHMPVPKSQYVTNHRVCGNGFGVSKLPPVPFMREWVVFQEKVTEDWMEVIQNVLWKYQNSGFEWSLKYNLQN